MLVDELEQYLSALGLVVQRLTLGEQTYLHIKDVGIGGGTLDGKRCEVAILRTTETPWVPQAAVHVRPHLVTMGQASSQASPLGPDWQYLSRRFDKAPTSRAFLAFIYTVLGEL